MISANSLAPQQKIYLTILAWLAALVLIILFIAKPLISQIRNDGLELAQKKQGLELFYADWQALEKAQKDYQTMQNELSGLPALLPANDALKFIVLIEKFSQATNNQQTVSIAAAKTTGKQEKNAVDFQISLRGGFPDLMKFLIYLENAPYYNQVKSLDARRLTSKENEGASGALNTILNVTAYQ